MYDGGSMTKTAAQGFIAVKDGSSLKKSAGSMVPKLPSVKKVLPIAETSRSSNEGRYKSVTPRKSSNNSRKVYIETAKTDKMGRTQIFKKSINLEKDHFEGVQSIISGRSVSHKKTSENMQ